jgi:hypothetical protein
MKCAENRRFGRFIEKQESNLFEGLLFNKDSFVA